MINMSRRRLAQYGADRLVAGDKLTDLARHLASVLIESRRASEVQLLVWDIMHELESRGVIAEVNVASARTLPGKLSLQISNYIKQAVKVEEIILNQTVEPALLGGLRIETANRTWDNTLIKKIDDIRKGVLNGKN